MINAAWEEFFTTTNLNRTVTQERDSVVKEKTRTRKNHRCLMEAHDIFENTHYFF